MDKAENKKNGEDQIVLPPLPVLPYLDKPIKKGEDIEVKRVNDLPLRGYSVVFYAQKRQISSSRKNVYLEAFRQECQAVLDIVLERIKYCKGNQPQDRIGFFIDYGLWCKNLTKWVEESMFSKNINVNNVDDLSEFFKLCDSQETLHKRYELMSSITWEIRKKEIHYNIKKSLEFFRKGENDANQKFLEFLRKGENKANQPTASSQESGRKKDKPDREDMIFIDLSRFSKGGSLTLLGDLIADISREGITLDKKKHGKSQPRALKEVLKVQGYENVAKQVKLRKGRVKLYIPVEKITTKQKK